MCRARLALAVLPLVAVVGWADPPKAQEKENSRYEFRREHDPDGTGKFYLGREIAQVMGHQAAGWLERPEREQEEQPAKLIETLKFKAGGPADHWTRYWQRRGSLPRTATTAQGDCSFVLLLPSALYKFIEGSHILGMYARQMLPNGSDPFFIGP